MRRLVRYPRRITFVAVIVLALVLVALPGAAFGAVTTTRISVAAGGGQASGDSDAPAISSNGRYVAFESTATDLVSGDTNGDWDVFVHDRLTGATERVSVATGGGQGNEGSYSPAISADGRFVVFDSYATNLVPGDTNHAMDTFVHDRLLNTTERVDVASNGGQADSGSGGIPSISADGRYVAFESVAATLVANDTNGHTDVFVRDRVAQTTERVSVASDGGQGGDNSFWSSISANGRFVTFVSGATNLVAGDTNGVWDVFVHDRVSGVTERASVATGGGQAAGISDAPAISADGRYVAFDSQATTLVAGDTNGHVDVFVRDRLKGTTDRVSVSSGGAQGADDSGGPAISSTGRYIAFYSSAANLVGGDTNGKGDIFVRDLAAGITERVSVATDGAQGNGDSAYESNPAISADGRNVAFDSVATNLVANDTNNADDVFVADRGRLSISLTRTPSKSRVTYRRRRGVAKFSLAVTVKDARGVRIAGATVYLRTSKNGRSKWHTASTLTTNASGVATKAFRSKKHSTTYYAWTVPATDADLGAATGKQKVVVKR